MQTREADEKNLSIVETTPVGLGPLSKSENPGTRKFLSFRDRLRELSCAISWD